MNMRFRPFPSRFGLFPYIFLVYILFPIYYVLQEKGLKELLGAIMVVLFLVTYRQLYFAIGKQSFHYWLALQLAIILVNCVFYNPNYVFLGFFPANFIGYYKNKMHFRRAMVGLILVLLGPFLIYIYRFHSFLSLSDSLYFFPFILIMMISPFGVRSTGRRMELERKLDQANQHIQELVKREERVRIARDLHDTLGHTLSLLTLKSQLVQRLVDKDTERAKTEAKEIEQTSRATLKQVRELVSDMRAITLSEELVHIQQILQAAGITYQYEGEWTFSSLSPITQNILSLCIREAITNVVKHSRASHCTVAVSQKMEQVEVIIQDDGLGIDSKKGFGNGLTGMEERLALIDGQLKVKGHNGTRIQIHAPIVKRAGGTL